MNESVASAATGPLHKICPVCALRFSPYVTVCPKHLVLLVDRYDNLIGTTINDGQLYIERFLGQGGMSYVYSGRQLEFDRPVAIKFLKLDLCDELALKRFQQEGAITAQLRHKHIARFYTFGKMASGESFIVMELLDGVSIDVLIRRQQLTPALACKLLRQTAQALQHAHSANIIHRDVKPSNVVICQDADGEYFAKLVDFGLATRLDVMPEQRLTQPGYTVGTYGFMSPEQTAGMECDNRSDIYSFGCLAKYIFETCRYEEPDYDNIIAKCTAENPNSRFQSMDDLCYALDALDRKIACSDTHQIRTPDSTRKNKPIARMKASPKKTAILTAAWALSIIALFLICTSDLVMSRCLLGLETSKGALEPRKIAPLIKLVAVADWLVRVDRPVTASTLLHYIDEQTPRTTSQCEATARAAEMLGAMQSNNILAESYFTRAVQRYMWALRGYGDALDRPKCLDLLRRLSNLTQNSAMHPSSGGSLEFALYTAISMYDKFYVHRSTTKDQLQLVLLCFERARPVAQTNGDYAGSFVVDGIDLFDILACNEDNAEAVYVLTKTKAAFKQWLADSHRPVDAKRVDELRSKLQSREKRWQAIKKRLLTDIKR